MDIEDLEKLKKLIITLKTLDYTEDDLQKVLKIDKKQIQNLMKHFNII